MITQTLNKLGFKTYFNYHLEHITILCQPICCNVDVYLTDFVVVIRCAKLDY